MLRRPSERNAADVGIFAIVQQMAGEKYGLG